MQNPPLLRMDSVGKSFPGVRALDNVSLELRAGEVLALLGENGAGKSTLIKILAGAQAPDTGSIQINGVETRLRNPVQSRRAGIAVIHQEFNLVPTLTAAENLFLGQERSRFGWIRQRDEASGAGEWFRRIGADINPVAKCRDLSVAQQQAIEIARALVADARIVVMDEPTAALTSQEVDRLFAIVRELKKQGIGVVYVSHRLDEIFALADRVTVLRDGQHVGTKPIEAINRGMLIEMMVGRRLDQEFPKRRATIGEPRLVVNNLTRSSQVRDVSFTIRRGEVLALTGLIGSGRTETARLLFGADQRERGDIVLDGKQLVIASPRDAITAGIALLTEDRKAQGLVLGRSARDNFSLANLRQWSWLGWIDQGQERNAFQRFVDRLRIRLASPEQPVATLSGGNQQKVLLARWLQRDCEVVIFDEPTRGVDVGAKVEIYERINELASEGKAVLVISSELLEVLGIADRILVMREGRIVGEIVDVANATQQQIMTLALGG
jgi:ribose transport system ATP-binding protein